MTTRAMRRRKGRTMPDRDRSDVDSVAPTVMPLAAILAHWRPGWIDAPWNEAVSRAWAKEPTRMAALAEEIKSAGIRKPIVLGSDGQLWDGHHRIAAACRLGLDSVPVYFAALASCRFAGATDPCPTCGLPAPVHTLWCPRRPGPPETADDVLARCHAVFNDPSRAWFAEHFWNAFAAVSP